MNENSVTINSEIAAGYQTLRLVGEIDLANASDTYGRVSELIDECQRTIVLDLDPIDYIDSAGLKSLLRLGDDLRRTNRRLAFVASPSGISRRVLELTGVASAFDVYDNHESVQATFGSTVE